MTSSRSSVDDATPVVEARERRYGVAGGAPLLTLEGHSDWVRAVACHGVGDDWRIVSGSDDGTVRVWDGAAGAVYPLGSGVVSVALAPRAGEVDVFASVGKSFARLALRAGPSELEERVKEERPRVEEENARRAEQARRKKRKSGVCLIS